MGGVGLGQGLVEGKEIFPHRELGIGLPAVAIELKLRCAGSFADNEEVDLAFVFRAIGASTEAECRRRFAVSRRSLGAKGGQTNVLKHVDGIEIVGDAIVFPGEEEQQKQSDSGSHACRPANPPGGLAPQRLASPAREGGQDEGGDVEHDDENDARKKIVEQFAGLAGIGCEQIEKHVYSDDRMPIQIDQYHLKGRKKHQWEEYPQHSPWSVPPAQGGGVEREGQQKVHQAVDQRHGLGIGQAEVGQRQHQHPQHECCAGM